MTVTDVATSRVDTAIEAGHVTAMATGMAIATGMATHRATIVTEGTGTVTEVAAGIGAPLAACKF